MALIYLVQSSSELEGQAGYSHGLLQGEHQRLLVTFAEYQGKVPSIFKPRTTPVVITGQPKPKKEKS